MGRNKFIIREFVKITVSTNKSEPIELTEEEFEKLVRAIESCSPKGQPVLLNCRGDKDLLRRVRNQMGRRNIYEIF